MRIARLISVLFLCFFAAASAQAKGIVLINTGDELFEVAPFPQDVIDKYPDARNDKAGYKCHHFGIFWADAWTWDCKLVAVSPDNSYSDLPASLVARLEGESQYRFSNAKRSFWNHYALWVALGVFVLAALLGRARS